MVEIKFCGMTRPEDARQAAILGARYVGVIFADSPRRLSEDDARRVFSAVPAGVRRVGVFGVASAEQIGQYAERVGLDVVQLHGDPDAATVADVRRGWSGQVWTVQRIDGTELPPKAADLFDVADAVVLDAKVAGKLGGTGVALPWDALREWIAPLRTRRARLVLAGGLNADNVATAVAVLQPDVVDVSSGVESSVGVKDPDRMRAFRDAVRTAGTR